MANLLQNSLVNDFIYLFPNSNEIFVVSKSSSFAYSIFFNLQIIHQSSISIGQFTLSIVEFFRQSKSFGCGKLALTGPIIPFENLSLPSENWKDRSSKDSLSSVNLKYSSFDKFLFLVLNNW